MPDDGITLLCTGDLHLGRRPSRLPGGVSPAPLSTRQGWEHVVRAAIEQRADAVVVAGDIGDRENRYFEAFGAFEAGVATLEEAGIPIVAVAGNHDAEFFSRLVDAVDADNLHALGTGGEWELLQVGTDTETSIEFVGWSFPRRHVVESPLSSYSAVETDVPFRIGVLHADLDAQASNHAPVTTAELRSTPLDCWILGHIHTPGIRHDENPLVVYPGSPQPLDPGEPGRHGPWVVRWTPETGWDADQLGTATVRYETISVDVRGVPDPEGTLPAISTAIEETLATIEQPGLSVLLPRIRLMGRCPAHGALANQATALEERIAIETDGVHVSPEKVVIETAPDVDLTDLAGDTGPVAYLAELLISLEEDDLDDSHQALLAQAGRAVRSAHSAPPYDLLRREGDDTTPDDVDARDALEREAHRLLEELLAQKEGGG